MMASCHCHPCLCRRPNWHSFWSSSFCSSHTLILLFPCFPFLSFVRRRLTGSSSLCFHFLQLVCCPFCCLLPNLTLDRLSWWYSQNCSIYSQNPPICFSCTWSFQIANICLQRAFLLEVLESLYWYIQSATNEIWFRKYNSTDFGPNHHGIQTCG